MQDFQGKVAVITGAASGIGRAIAERCVRAGAKVVLADIDAARLAEAEAELQAAGGTILAVRTDVSKRDEVEMLAERTIETFGQVHLLFNNAGVAAGGAPWEATWNDWEWVIGVDLWGVIHGVKVFTPMMLAQNTECHIVNTSSSAGLVAGTLSAPYSVTKHGVVALSECLYFALQQRKSLVKVSVLCPGPTRTDIINVERHRPAELQNAPVPMTPERQASLAAFQKVMESAMPPGEVAEIVFDAIRNERFYVLTHPEWLELVKLRMDQLLQLENPISPMATLQKVMSVRAAPEPKP